MQTKAVQNGWIFSGTNTHTGRRLAVTPENSSMKHLVYGRVILTPELRQIRFETGPRETGLICLSGQGKVKAQGVEHTLNPLDVIYIPKNETVEIETNSQVDLAECSAAVEGTYPLQFVRYAEIELDPSLKFKTGGPTSSRTINILLGKNIEAGRILAGFTISEPGHWTSWPPHEHAEMLEELYVYHDMPPPSFGVQLVYTELAEPEFLGIVREGDAVVMPRGFHPNVSAPGHSIKFLWMMAAHREVEDRQFGVVTVQPGFDLQGTGLESSRD
jgi:5-deoxy-glucuronate isomerase